MSRAESLQQQRSNIISDTKKTGEDIKAAKSAVNTNAALNLMGGLKKAVDAYNVSTYQSEASEALELAKTPEEQSKRISEVNEQNSFKMLITPEIGLRAQAIKDDLAVKTKKLPLETQHQNESLVLNRISKNQSKFKTAAEYRHYMNSEHDQLKKLYGTATSNFQTAFNAYYDDAEAAFNAPASGTENYINTVRSSWIDSTIKSAIGSGSIKTKADIDALMKVHIYDKNYNPNFAANQEREMLGKLLEYNSNPDLVKELQEDPKYARLINDDLWEKYHAYAMEKAEIVEAKEIADERGRAKEIDELNKDGIGVHVTSVHRNDPEFDTWLFFHDQKLKSSSEIRAAANDPANARFSSKLIDISNNHKAAFEQDFLKYSSHPRFGLDEGLLTTLNIGNIEEGQMISDEYILNLNKNAPTRYTAFNHIVNTIYKGDSEKTNIFSESEKNKLKEVFSKTTIQGKWKLANAMYSMYQGMDDVAAYHRDFAPQIASLAGDKNLEEYMRKYRETGDPMYESLWTSSQKTKAADPAAYNNVNKIIYNALSYITDPDDFSKNGKWLADMITADIFAEADGNAIMIGEIEKKYFEENITGSGINSIINQLESEMEAGNLPFYLGGGRSEDTGWLSPTYKGAAGGAMFGAGIGARFGGLVGAGIGGTIGAGVGAYGGYTEETSTFNKKNMISGTIYRTNNPEDEDVLMEKIADIKISNTQIEPTNEDENLIDFLVTHDGSIENYNGSHTKFIISYKEQNIYGSLVKRPITNKDGTPLIISIPLTKVGKYK